MPRTKKPPRGRPPLGAAAHSRYVPIKLTPAEDDAVASRVNAGEADSKSEWVRAAIAQRLAR